MASKRLLRFKHNMPFNLETKLVNKYGYAVDQRIVGQFISFRFSPRDTVIKPDAFQMPIVATRQTELLKRCDAIVDFFPDPYNSQRAVRTRLHNMSQTLPASERKFVQEFMDDNFPVSEKGL